MRHRYTRAWVLAEAVKSTQSADRLQRQFFQPGQVGQSPCWEPPVDIYENGGKLSLLIALPGVAPKRYAIVLEPQALVVRGERSPGAPPVPEKFCNSKYLTDALSVGFACPMGAFNWPKCGAKTVA